MNKKKLIVSLILLGCISIIAVFSLIRFLDEITQEEAINDVICKVECSHDMAKITLCESNRKFTLLVEKEDSMGNSNFDRINSFVVKSKTIIMKKQNSNLVYLINERIDTLLITFEAETNGNLVDGKIIE